MVLSATSVSISAQTLIELGALRSRAGATILGAAVIDDVLAILLLSVVVALMDAGKALLRIVAWQFLLGSVPLLALSIVVRA